MLALWARDMNFWLYGSKASSTEQYGSVGEEGLEDKGKGGG